MRGRGLLELHPVIECPPHYLARILICAFMPNMAECATPFALERLLLKRVLDVAVAGLLLAVTLPLLVIVAIVIKLDSDGPVIFRQLRMGRNFMCFQLLKLRTMRCSGDGLAYTLGADPRITRTGRWLRWFKIDELPQLWTAARGSGVDG
jgi:lipopolysaccharide/colanic/teichoic acid biosynthesis glycosyltransferase